MPFILFSLISALFGTVVLAMFGMGFGELVVGYLTIGTMSLIFVPLAISLSAFSRSTEIGGNSRLSCSGS